MSDISVRRRIDAALALAQKGDFSEVPVIVQALSDEDGEVRIKAAYRCEAIGPPAALEPLARMATDDPVSDNRNQAMFALVAIGLPAVIPALIAELDDEDVARRDDARTALYRVLGKDVLPQLADEEEGGGERDEEERGRVDAWWQSRKSVFDEARVYAFGEPASPAVFIQQLKTTTTSLPDAYLGALRDWTGEDFGEAPLPKVIAKWEKWWASNRAGYEPGRRYYFGHPVPER